MSFHVPESSRFNSIGIESDATYGNNGAFFVESIEPGWALFLIASDGMGWEHVSVSARRKDRRNERSRIPNWREMSYVKDMCWDDEDVVVQFHPRKSEYVNAHPHVLHLWRLVDGEIPTPNPLMVGPLEAIGQ